MGGLSRRWARSCVYRAFRGNYRLGNGGTDPGRHRGGRRAALSIVPHGRRGKRLHPSVFYRWASSGKNGHVLETVTTPSGRVPTKSGVLRFFAALTGRAPAAATPGQVRRQHAKAEAELDAIGIG